MESFATSAHGSSNPKRYPLSLSGNLVDANGIVKRDALEKTGRLVYQTRFCKKQAFDLSDVVNRQVAAAHGEGVVDLAISARHEGKDCYGLRVTGDIVRRRRP